LTKIVEAEHLTTNRSGTVEKQLRASMPIDLGDGLQIRFARKEDIDPLCELVGTVWPNWAGLKDWSREFYEGVNPKASHQDTLVVEEKRNDRLVSYLTLISRNWTYGGVPFRCGQIEAVGTDPKYRQKGLMVRLFDVVHQLSAARGELMQVIWGIAWVYRKVGYAYALPNFGAGSWQVPKSLIPPLPDGEAEPFPLRPLDQEDQALVRELYQRGTQRGIFAVVKDEQHWAFLFQGYRHKEALNMTWRVITDKEGRAIGYVTLFLFGGTSVTSLELAAGHSYLQLMPSLLRQLAYLNPEKPLETVNFSLPPNHPAGKALPAHTRHNNPAAALYVRIPDMVAYLRHIRPALEANLVGTETEGYTGELKINCLRWGLRFGFENGRITAIEPWLGEGIQKIHHQPRFVFDTFTQLVGGFKRCEELMEAYPDCWMDAQSSRLLDALFPRFEGGLWFNGY